MPYRQTGFKWCLLSAVEDIKSTINVHRHINKNNRVAIDVFFAARVARQKGLRLSAPALLNSLRVYVLYLCLA